MTPEQINQLNPALAKNYDSLQTLINEGTFDFEKFGIEDKVKKYAQQFRKIADEIKADNYTPELKLQFKKLNKDFKKFDVSIKNRIKIKIKSWLLDQPFFILVTKKAKNKKAIIKKSKVKIKNQR